MSNTDYPACIKELYESEVLGEKAFLALVNVAINTREKYHLATILQLETETKARLRPLMLKHGFNLVEEVDDSIADSIVAAYEENTWVDFVAGLQPLVDQTLARFQQIAAAGPAEDQDILQSMITHEATYVPWIAKETAGQEGALDAVIAELKYPLIPPQDSALPR